MTKQLTPAQKIREGPEIGRRPGTIKPLTASRTWEKLESPLYSWRPREDQPEKFDQPTSIVADKASRVSITLGGTGVREINVLCRTLCMVRGSCPSPPTKNCPFWIVVPTLDMAAGTLWNQKLSQFIPKDAIAPNGISYYSAAQEHPKAIRLKPWANGNNYIHRSTAESQAAGIASRRHCGGLDQRVPHDWSVFTEIFGARGPTVGLACSGGVLPLDSPAGVGRAGEVAASGLAVLPLEHRCNPHLPPGWADEYLAGLPEEIRATRETGQFASYEGCIYKELAASTSVIRSRFRRLAAVPGSGFWEQLRLCVVGLFAR